MTPGRPQQLPYVSPPDKKTSQEKSGSNIVVEWMSEIKKLAKNGYEISSVNACMKNEKFQRIIGICDAVIMVLKENQDMEFAKAAAWISTALAVIVGIEVTHSAWCLWAFLLPLLMS